MRKIAESDENKPNKISSFKFDYRYQRLSKDTINLVKKLKQDENFDNSVYSFFGHEILATLIRCHFSPQSVNNKKYLYTGSYDGKIYIYDILTGNNVGILDNLEQLVIRDCIWHPYDTAIYSGNFEGTLDQWYFNQNQIALN